LSTELTNGHERVDDKREAHIHKGKGADKRRRQQKMQEGARETDRLPALKPSPDGKLSTPFYCCGALEDPIFVPITSPEMMISTLRFCWRPAGVSLLATGFDFPKPVAVIELGSSPCVIK
jgi:hypothetical protein